MDKQFLRQIVREHLAQNPLDPRVSELVKILAYKDSVCARINDPNTTAKSLEQYLLQIRDQLNKTYALCQESGEISRQDFIRYIKSAEALATRLHKALPPENALPPATKVILRER